MLVRMVVVPRWQGKHQVTMGGKEELGEDARARKDMRRCVSG